PAPFAQGQTLGEALLTPTKIYVKPVLAALRAGLGIKALAHITGGGFQENIPRVLPKHLAASVDLDRLTPPKVVGWLARQGGIETREMLRTFNCGVGMLVAVETGDAESLVALLKDHGETGTIVGTLTERTGDAVEFSGSLAL